jgi:hypothetical protein
MTRFVQDFREKKMDSKVESKLGNLLKDLQVKVDRFPEKEIQALANLSGDKAEIASKSKLFKRALDRLREEPWNEKALGALKNPPLADKKNEKHFQELSDLADKIETVSTSHDLESQPDSLQSVLKHKNRNPLVRFFSSGPLGQAVKEVGEVKDKMAGLQKEALGIEKAIKEIRSAKRAKEFLEIEYKFAQRQIFDELPEVRAVFGKAKEKLNKRFEKMEKDGTKVDVAFENLASVEKMEAMGTDDYERYFDSSDPALPDRHAMIENYSEKVLAKISGELKKTLENKLGLSKAQKALASFEGKLGDLAKSDGYAKIKYLVLLKLSRDSDVSGPTKILIRRLLSQGVEEGSIRQVLAFN